VAKPNVRGEPKDRAARLAQRYLRYGTRSAAELRAYLKTRHVPDRLIERLISECSQKGLVDDRACAKLWATTLADRGYAWVAIHQQLVAKGLNERLITEIITPLQRRADDEARARAAVQDRLRGVPQARHPAQAGRLAQLLSRRGFDSDLIVRVLAQTVGLPDHETTSD
jgi:SOS response regulatory protein OraA/RecX